MIHIYTHEVNKYSPSNNSTLSLPIRNPESSSSCFCFPFILHLNLIQSTTIIPIGVRMNTQPTVITDAAIVVVNEPDLFVCMTVCEMER